MTSFHPVFTEGTHRLASPEATLSQIEPWLHEMKITRCANISGLDESFGIPVFSAIRPLGKVLQVSNGKGVTPIAAQVSALMEAIELHHAENPCSEKLIRTSYQTLAQAGKRVYGPEWFGNHLNRYFSDNYCIDWIAAEHPLTQEICWIPACAVYFLEPSLCAISTNGLASGNHSVEALLHALYELLERDAISRLDYQGTLKIKEQCLILDWRTIPDDFLLQVGQQIEAAQNKLVLLYVPSVVNVHTFWAILLNPLAVSATTTLNVGAGTHHDPVIAASRAITEAIQSRLAFIHGAREDIRDKPVYRSGPVKSSVAYRYFDQLEKTASWEAIPKFPYDGETDLAQISARLLNQLKAAGHSCQLKVDLTHPTMNIPVIKLLIPSLLFKSSLF